MENIPADKLISLRAGLLALREHPEEELLAATPEEHAAVYDFLDFLDGANASSQGIWRYLGLCYLTVSSCLRSADKISQENEKNARLEMAELRRIADVLKRCGIENPEGISPDVIDREGLPFDDIDDIPEKEQKCF